MNNKPLKRVTSFLMACAMSFSTLVTNAESVFADSGGKATATLINDAEHGTLTFAENSFEDVYVDVPLSELEDETNGYSFTVNEDGEVEMSEAVDLESEPSSEETSEENTEESIENSTEESTKESTEEPTEKAIEYTQVVDPNSKLINAGDLVTINAEPEEGYSVETVYVLTDSGKSIVYDFDNNKISFNMPKEDVTIRATFGNTVSDIQLDDTLSSYAVYLKSNLNKDYVKFSKCDSINAIKVKQTIVDENEFIKDNKEITLATFDGPDAALEDVGRYLLNVHDTVIPVYNVDDNSDYYVAFVNTLQFDEFTYRDYALAKNNNNAELINGSMLDENTGILYINKEYISDISNTDDEAYISEHAIELQVQLLQSTTTTSTDHQINVIVDDTLDCLDIENGTILTDFYENTVTLKLCNNVSDNNIGIIVNDIIIGTINLAESVEYNTFSYDSDTGILVLYDNTIDINTIEFKTINTTDTDTDTNVSDVVNAATYPDVLDTYPTWNLVSGDMKTGSAMMEFGLFSITTYAESSDEFTSYAGNSGDAYNPGNAGELAKALAKGNSIKSSWLNNANANSYTYTHKIDVSSLKNNFTINGTKWNVSFVGDRVNALLGCCHVTTAVDDEDSGNTLIRIYKIDEDNNKVYWGLVSKSRGAQTGAGVFVSKMKKLYGSLKVDKGFIGSSALTNTITSKDGCVLELRKGSTKIGKFTSSCDDNDTSVTWTAKAIQSGITASGDTLNNIPSGDYTLVETKAPIGYNKIKPRTVTIVAGETTKLTGDNRPIDYPEFGKINLRKTDKTTGAAVANAEYSLYYTEDTGNISKAFNNYKISNNSTTLSINNISGLTRIATFKTNSSGVGVPTVVTTICKPKVGDNVVNCPAVESGNKLTNCPIGYYLLVETKAPTGYIIEGMENGHPIFYTTYFTDSEKTEEDSIKYTNLVNESDNVSRHKWTYDTQSNQYKGKKITGDNVNYTWNTSDKRLSFSAKKTLVNPEDNSNIKLSNDALDILLTNSNYSVSNAKFELYNSTKTTKYADGISLSNGNISWTLTNEGRNASLTAKGTVIYGFTPNTRVVLVETKVSLGTYNKYSTRETSYLIGEDGISIDSTTYLGDDAVSNHPSFIAMRMEKYIQLSMTDKIHADTRVRYELYPKGTDNYEQTDYERASEAIYNNLLNTDGYYTVQDLDNHLRKTISADEYDIVYYLLFNNCSSVDKKQYFLGLSFDVYYNTVAATSNRNVFPTVSVNTTTRTAKVLDKSTDKDDRFSSRVGSFTFKEVNGNIVCVAEVDKSFELINSKKSAKYNIHVANGNKIEYLPYGAYMIVETNANNSANSNTIYTSSSAVKYVYFNSTTANAVYLNKLVDMYNVNEELPISININKHDSKKSDADLFGAEYYIYYSNNEDKPTDLGSYTGDVYNKGKDFHLVGSFKITNEYLYDSDGNGTEIIDHPGIVYNNLFKTNTWGTTNGYPMPVNSTSDKYKNDVIDGFNYIKDNNLKITASLPYYMIPSAFIRNSNAKNTNDIFNKYSNFYGRPGHYVVVEVKAPDNDVYAISHEISYSYVSSGETFELNVNEPRHKDILNLSIEKYNPQGFDTVYSLDGTEFRLNYYSEADLNANNIKLDSINSVADVNKYIPTNVVYYNVKDNKISLYDTKYVNISKSNLTSIVNKRGSIEFESGIITITETSPAPNYTIQDADHFTINGNDVGHTMLVKLSEVHETNGSNTNIYIQKYYMSSNKWIKLDSTSSITNVAKIPNYTGDPFEFSKLDFNEKPMKNIPFTLNMYDTTTNKLVHSWTFSTDENGYFNSEDSEVFANVSGRPLVKDSRYEYSITENSSANNKNAYLLKTDKFSYRGQNIFGQFNNYIISAANEYYNFFPPTMTSNAWTINENNQIFLYSNNTINDTVHIKDLAVNNYYVLEAIAMDVTDPKHPVPLKDANGKYITGSTDFVLLRTGLKLIDDIDVDVELTFTGDSKIFAGKTINVFEYLAYGGPFTVAASAHGGYTSKINLSVFNYPYDGTLPTVSDAISNENMRNSTEIKNDDDVVIGYAVKDNKNIINVNNNTVVTANKGFIKNPNGTDIIKHADATDVRQNIYFPIVETEEADISNNSHWSGVKYNIFGEYNTIVILDKVKVTNIPDGNYYIKYAVKDYLTDKTVSSGTIYRALTGNANRTYTITINGITIINSSVTSDKFYVTEEIYNKDKTLVATHTDKVDSQTGYVSKIIGTTAQNKITRNKLFMADTTGTLEDTVNYKNLSTNLNYTLKGYLVEKDTENIIATATKTFKPATNTGNVSIDFTFSTANLEGKTLVVYEYLFNGSEDIAIDLVVNKQFNVNAIINNINVNNKLVAMHYDNGDANQTVYVPKVGTQAFSNEFNKKLIPATKDAKVVDVVNYTNVLDTEHTYYLHGYLVNKKTNKIVATSENSFSSKTRSGSTFVTFNFDASELEGSTLVVYEYLYFDAVTNTLKVGDTFSDDTIMKADANPNHTNYYKLIAKHYDTNDAKQTVYIPSVKTNAIATNNTAGDNNKLIVPKSKETTIVDKIDITNVMNDTYSAFGFLVDLTDHKIVARGSNTDIVVNSTTEPSSITANVEFKFDASKYVNHKLVVYEYVYYGKQTTVTIGSSLTVGTKFDESKVETSTPDGYLVGKHVSDTDKSQIVKVLPMVDFLKVDNVSGEALAGAEYRIVNPDTKVQVDRWTTTKNAHSVALAPGHYILEELSAPDGHALNDPVEFDVALDENETLNVTYTIGGAEPRYTTKTTNYDNGTTETYKQYEIRSNDVRLSNLPTAGGFGTHPFTYVGIMMFAVAAFVLYRRKKETNV